MKILYAVQATGNGHISRAMELMPYLKQYGRVDVFLSGSNSHLQANLPIVYRSKGVGLLYNANGALAYPKIVQQLNVSRLVKEVRQLPVEKYDVVINDFECITAMACTLKKIPSVSFGHQASFQSPLVPRPHKKEWLGEFLLKHYGAASNYVGLHFNSYDNFIFQPVIKKQILHAIPKNKGHITVYLSAYADLKLFNVLRLLKPYRFHVFSKEVVQATIMENVTFIPIQQQLFNESMISAEAVITGAGFETPAEVLHLQKKLMVIPIKGQYEQLCNAAALTLMGVLVVDRVDDFFVHHFNNWIQQNTQQQIRYNAVAEKAISYLFDNYPFRGSSLDLLYPNFIFN